ncbi:MAG: hypothetical protein ACOCT0_00575 [Halobacteriota archaeon]
MESRTRDLVDEVWGDAVESWVDDELEDGDMEAVEQLGLLDEFEFFWDADVDRVGYESPAIPRDWKNEHDDVLDSWAQVSRLNVALDGLGQRVRERVESRLDVDG